MFCADRVPQPPKNDERMARWGAFLFVYFLWACKENGHGGAGAGIAPAKLTFEINAVMPMCHRH